MPVGWPIKKLSSPVASQTKRRINHGISDQYSADSTALSATSVVPRTPASTPPATITKGNHHSICPVKNTVFTGVKRAMSKCSSNPKNILMPTMPPYSAVKAASGSAAASLTSPMLLCTAALIGAIVPIKIETPSVRITMPKAAISEPFTTSARLLRCNNSPSMAMRPSNTAALRRILLRTKLPTVSQNALMTHLRATWRAAPAPRPCPDNCGRAAPAPAPCRATGSPTHNW